MFSIQGGHVPDRDSEKENRSGLVHDVEVYRSERQCPTLPVQQEKADIAATNLISAEMSLLLQRQSGREILDVVIEHEFVRMGPKLHGFHFALHLVVDPGLDQVFSEHIAAEKEFVILLERLQCLGE